MHATSQVQSLVTKSSCESETVAASDYGGMAIWTREFLIAQGYTVGPVEYQQDNKSAMQLLNKGMSTSKRTRHIGIRFFWIADRIKAGDLVIQYESTETMLADVLTKPLQGSRFVALRDRLLGKNTDSAYAIF